MACSQLRSHVRLSALFPTLVAPLPALAHSAVLVCTHWHVRVPVLCSHGASAITGILHVKFKLGGHDCEACYGAHV